MAVCIMNQTDYQRQYARRKRYGFTKKQAKEVPAGMPLWMWKIEQAEGMSFAKFVNNHMKFGVSDAEIARSCEVKKDTMGYWIRKYRRLGLIDEKA
jgi:hypothetical protein